MDYWRPSVLLIGSGGTKGYLELGALALLDVLQTLDRVEKIIGVSVGAVLGLLKTAGYKFNELLRVAENLDLFQDVFRAEAVFHDGFLLRGGLFGLQAIRETLSRLVRDKFSFVPKLQELYDRTHIDLVLVTTNVTRCEAVYLSHHTHPDLSCVEATLMSLNIPFIFEYINLDGEFYADGALSDPCPLHLAKGKNTLIVRIQDEIREKNSFPAYIYSVLSVSMEVMAKEKLRLLQRPENARRYRLLALKSSELNPVNPALDLGGKKAMIKEGYQITVQAIHAGLFRK